MRAAFKGGTGVKAVDSKRDIKFVSRSFGLILRTCSTPCRRYLLFSFGAFNGRKLEFLHISRIYNGTEYFYSRLHVMFPGSFLIYFQRLSLLSDIRINSIMIMET